VYKPYLPIRFEDQARVLLDAKVPAFSFIYGIPPKEILEECRTKSIVTIGAATTPDEAAALQEAGVDAIAASGFEAGGHRGSFLRAAEDSLTGTMSLVPKWAFDDATFDRSAGSFDNPDHVSIVIHNYRWRLGLADGEPKYGDLEKRLAEGPVITVPAITLEGDANGAPHPDAGSYAKKFSGKYAHRIIEGGIGHNLPQEAPQAFAKAVVDVDAGPEG